MRHQDLNWDYSAILTYLRAIFYMMVMIASLSTLRFVFAGLEARMGVSFLHYFSWLFEVLYYPYQLILPAITMAFFRESPIMPVENVSKKRIPWLAGLIGFLCFLAVANVIDVRASDGGGLIDMENYRGAEGVIQVVVFGFIWAGAASLLHWIWLSAAPHRWLALHVVGIIVTTGLLMQMEGHIGGLQLWLMEVPSQGQSEFVQPALPAYVEQGTIVMSWLIVALVAALPYCVGLGLLHEKEVRRRDWAGSL